MHTKNTRRNAPSVADTRAQSEPEGRTASTRFSRLSDRLAKLAPSRRFSTIALTVFGALATAIGIFSAVTRSSAFSVTDIVIEGSSLRSREELAERAGLTIGQNLFRVDLTAAQRALLADPWIETAKLERKLPHTLRVVVHEHRAIAIAALGESLALVDEHGVAFKPLEESDKQDLPILTFESIDADRTSHALAALADLVREFSSHELAQRNVLHEVHAGPTGYALVLGHDGLRLELGPRPAEGALDDAKLVLDELHRRKKRVTSLEFLEGAPSSGSAGRRRLVARIR